MFYLTHGKQQFDVHSKVYTQTRGEYPGTTKEETKTNQDKDEEIKSLKEQMALQNKV